MNEKPFDLRAVFRPHLSWAAILAAVGLTLLGITAISAIPRHVGYEKDFATYQMEWLPFAVVAMLICMLASPRQIIAATYPAMAIVLLLLLVTALPGVPESVVPRIKGTHHWINLRFMMLQPSELAKIAFVLTLAKYLRFRENFRTLGGLLIPFGLMFLPVALILREPDLGTAILFPVALFAMLLSAGARLKHIGSLAGLALLAVVLIVAAIYTLPASLQPLEKHQQLRIRSLISQFRGDHSYDETAGYQQNKAMTLVGTGQLHGLGAERAARILTFNWVPEPHSDMIFSVIVNRWGLVGGTITIGLFAVLIFTFLFIAARHKDPLARLTLVGFAALLFAQVTISIGMSLGLMPIVGIPLPLVSYGGSSLVATYAMMGIALSFATQRPAIVSRPSFEFDRPRAALR